MRIITVSVIALFTLFVGTAHAEQPKPNPTIPIPQTLPTLEYRRIPQEPLPQGVEVLPAGVPKDQSKRCPQWEAKFREHKLPVVTFSYIAWRESRCSVSAHNTTLNRNGTQDLGLVQVNSSWKTVTRNICGTDITGLFSVNCNLKVAKYLYDNGGLRHWSL